MKHPASFSSKDKSKKKKKINKNKVSSAAISFGTLRVIQYSHAEV